MRGLLSFAVLASLVVTDPSASRIPEAPRGSRRSSPRLLELDELASFVDSFFALDEQHGFFSTGSFHQELEPEPRADHASFSRSGGLSADGIRGPRF